MKRLRVYVTAKKRFDSVKMMRDLRDRISRDIEGMSFEQEKAYIREGLHRFIASPRQTQMSGEDRSHPEVESAWAAELRERIRAFKAGEMKAISAEQALEEAEELLR